jgi:hypothetical protein
MSELHDDFAAWIAGGTRDELPRDVALHASGCSGCLEIAAAVDALAAVDPGGAEMPPVRIMVGAGRSGAPVRVARAALGAAAVIFTIAVGFIVGGGLFEPAPGGLSDAVSGTPGGAVLGDQGGAPTDSPTPSPSAGSAEPSPETTGSPGSTQSPDPPTGGGPPPVNPTTPAPSGAPTATPTTAPTPTPTVAPTPTPTPAPTCPIRLPCPSLPAP